MQVEEVSPPESFGPLTARESELLKRAGERVFVLSRRLAERDREVERLTAEVRSLRELLSENRNMREILSAQIASLQMEHEREYDERAELRRLVAGLHLQLQEVIPLLVKQQSVPEAAALPANGRDSTSRPRPRHRAQAKSSWADKLKVTATREFRLLTGGARSRR